jgi:hypothetical protein
MTINEAAALGLTPNAARENPDPSANLDRKSSQRNSTRRRPRGPAKWRSLDDLVRDGLLSTFVNLRSRP